MMDQDALHAAVRANPRNPQAWLALGRALAARGENEQARESFQRALKLAPNLSAAREALAALDRRLPPWLEPGASAESSPPSGGSLPGWLLGESQDTAGGRDLPPWLLGESSPPAEARDLPPWLRGVSVQPPVVPPTVGARPAAQRAPRPETPRFASPVPDPRRRFDPANQPRRGPAREATVSVQALLSGLAFVMVCVLCASAAVLLARTTTMPVAQSEALPTVPAEAQTTPEPGAEQQPTPVGSLTGAVASLIDVRRATVQIEARGSFVHPEIGLQRNVAGRGSGFIIDPSGIAVTNNHVVTGAALVKVWVGGEREPRNARILGVSECADLAIIDIDGENLPYLRWYNGEIAPGLEVYGAGFPLGVPEFTLSRGVVSAVRTDGKTHWASVPLMVEHDAMLEGGDSGGPLVTRQGELVGVNYAGAPDFDRYYAIARDQAMKMIALLQAGQDVDSIGVNGTAVREAEGTSGIWVASVKSGSSADQAGIQPGDIITKLEGLVLAADGTVADYCDILRSHDLDDTLSIEVLRRATGERLEGQLRGRMLTQVQEVAVEPAVTAEPQTALATAVPLTDTVQLGRTVTATGIEPETNRAVGVTDIFMQSADPIFVVTEVEQLPRGTRLAARWYRDGTLIEETPTVIADRDYRATFFEFHLQPSDPSAMTPGPYEVTLFINRAPAVTVPFTVRGP